MGIEGSLRPPSELSFAAFLPSRLRAAEVSIDMCIECTGWSCTGPPRRFRGAQHVLGSCGHACVRLYRATAYLRSSPDRERTAKLVSVFPQRSLTPKRQAD